MRRSLGVALWTLVGLVACVFGALSALVGTHRGRALLARAAEAGLKRVFSGSVEVGNVSGALLTGLTLSDVRLFDPDTTLVAWLPRAQLSYDPFDLVAGRVVLFKLTLRQPVINIVQHKTGRLNLEELLRLGGPDTGPHGPATLILFRNVQIEDGTVTLRLQARHVAPGDTAVEIQSGGPNGRVRVRRFEHLNTRLAALQISSPREPGIRIDVSRLAVESSDPDLRLVDVAGRLHVIGDSVEVDLSRVRFPGSALSRVRGKVRWPHDTLLYDLAARADSATLGDFHFIDRRLAGSAALAGDVRLRSHGGRVLEVRLSPLRLAWGSGTVTGRVTALTTADSGLAALRDADLQAEDFDLEFARPFLETLPFAGRLSGHTVASGPLAALTLEVDWVFRDSLAAGWPETRIRGKGEVNLAAQDGEGIRFQPFGVEAAAVDLGTVRRLVPAITLRGMLYAAGTLTGPLKNAQFEGTLEHQDGSRPPSKIAGTVRLDSRTDTLGAYADVTADSVSFDGLRGSFPTLPVHGAVAGPVKLAGTLAALQTQAELRSPGGSVAVTGLLQLGLPSYGARDLTLRGHNVDLARWLDHAPNSRLDFTLTGSVTTDSGTPPVGQARATLATSSIARAALDSGHVAVRFAHGRLYIDSLWVRGPGLSVTTTGSGSLGWSGGSAGAVALELVADSLSSLDSLVSWAVGEVGGAAGDGEDGIGDGEETGREAPGSEALAGTARVTLTLEGSLDSLGVEAQVSGRRVKWRGWEVPDSGRVRLVYRPGSPDPPGSKPALELHAAFDSLAHGGLGFAADSVAVQGTPDSLAWFARARLGEAGAFRAGGRFERRTGSGGDPVLALGLDSLKLQVPGDVWRLGSPAEVRVTDSVAAVSHLVLHSDHVSGELGLEGDLPTGGRAEAHFWVDGFPLAGVYALLQRDTSGVRGSIKAAVDLAGTRAAPVLSNGSFSLTDASVSEFHAPLLDGTFEYHDRRLSGAVQLWRSRQERILNVQAQLPLDLSLATVGQRQLSDRLSVRATADSVDLSVLEALTPTLRDVAGVFSADVGITGTWDAPRLEGSLEVRDAAAQIPAINVRYQDVNGRLALSGDTIVIRRLSARSDKGRAEVSGIVRLERLTHPVLALKIDADQFKALDLKNNVTVTASGQMALRGPVFGATLTGRAKVTSGVLYFADLVQKRLVNLDELADTSLASLIQEQRLGPEFQNVFLDSLRIEDLELEMGSDVWLRSNEANIQLAGTVRLTKQRSLYLVSGTLQAVRGTYRLKVGPVTREFVVTQGSVTYFGTPDQDAALDIEAKHVVHPVPSPRQTNPEDITVVAHITGSLLVPKVTLAAEKQNLSQTEVISYLLFGKSSLDLGGQQGGIADQRALIQSALSVLSGEIEQTIVSGGVPLRVDYVEIRPGGGGQGDPLLGWQLGVGWQLGPKTFVVLNGSFCGGRAVSLSRNFGISLQFRVSPEWRTEAGFEPVLICADPGAEPLAGTRQVGLDLFWEKRY